MLCFAAAPLRRHVTPPPYVLCWCMLCSLLFCMLNAVCSQVAQKCLRICCNSYTPRLADFSVCMHLQELLGMRTSTTAMTLQHEQSLFAPWHWSCCCHPLQWRCMRHTTSDCEVACYSKSCLSMLVHATALAGFHCICCNAQHLRAVEVFQH